MVVTIRPFISMSFCSFTSPFVTEPSALITIDITATYFFQFPSKVQVLIFLFAIIIIILLIASFLKPVLTFGLSLESDWHQVSYGLQDSSRYFGWS